ncbi:MAG: PAS domain S-box protein [Actinobacteria bacterium]|nr:PAS domain S-box protein [Actinomycetota bacterium]
MDEGGTLKEQPAEPERNSDLTNQRENAGETQAEAGGLSTPQGKYHRFLLENPLDMFTIIDREGRVLFNSPSTKMIMGYEQEELTGRSAFDLIHPDDREALMEMFSRGLSEAGATGYFEYRHLHKDGTWHLLESIANNLLDDPEVQGIVATSRDITERKRMEEELKQREEYFRAVVENTVDLILIIDADAKIKFANRASRTLLGYEPEELTGRSGLDLVHPDEIEWASAVVETAVRDDQYSPLLEVRVRHKDGSWLHMEGIGKNFLEHPAVEGIVLSFRDITDRKQAEQSLRDSEEMYRSLVAASPDAVTVTDLQGNITFVSPQTLRLHGYGSEEELLGKSAFTLIAPEDHVKAAAGLEGTLKEGRVRNLEFRFLRKNGTVFMAELNAALIRNANGEPQSLIAYTRDISERKRIEKELRDRNEELEAFAHTISHDLLTPVSIVEGYAKAALEADAEGRTEAERECLEAIARGARRMSDLINSLLQYAQAGHMDFESRGVDPEEILMEVLMDLEEDIRCKGVEVSVQNELPCVKVDAVKLRQVLNNLIGNAIKHMGNILEPQVEVGMEVQGRTATFFVRDNGIGIPAELQEKIFEPFRHFSLAGSQGLGIGLSTVKRAVAAWGGMVWVESQPGAGAAFFFTAPLVE